MTEALIKAVERLANETGNLRRDTARLHNRVDPEWSGEEPDYLKSRENDPVHLALVGRPKPLTEQELWQIIKALQEQLLASDYHLGAIRAHMDDICRDSISRAEMKPYLKDR